MHAPRQYLILRVQGATTAWPLNMRLQRAVSRCCCKDPPPWQQAGSSSLGPDDLRVLTLNPYCLNPGPERGACTAQLFPFIHYTKGHLR